MDYIPQSFLISTATYYYRLTTTLSPYIDQVNRTLSAIKNSFSQPTRDVLGFYEGVPICRTILQENIAAEKPQWYFYEHYNTFVRDIADNYNIDAVKSFPWLSADIICDGKKIADITDFVSTIYYIGALPPTPDVILTLWCYKEGYLLRRSHTQLVVICNEGDTHSFNFSPTPANDEPWLKSLGLSKSV